MLSTTYFLLLWFTALSTANLKYASNENMFQDGIFCSLQVQLENKKGPKVCFLLLQGSNWALLKILSPWRFVCIPVLKYSLRSWLGLDNMQVSLTH